MKYAGFLEDLQERVLETHRHRRRACGQVPAAPDMARRRSASIPASRSIRIRRLRHIDRRTVLVHRQLSAGRHRQPHPRQGPVFRSAVEDPPDGPANSHRPRSGNDRRRSGRSGSGAEARHHGRSIPVMHMKRAHVHDRPTGHSKSSRRSIAPTECPLLRQSRPREAQRQVDVEDGRRNVRLTTSRCSRTRSFAANCMMRGPPAVAVIFRSSGCRDRHVRVRPA